MLTSSEYSRIRDHLFETFFQSESFYFLALNSDFSISAKNKLCHSTFPKEMGDDFFQYIHIDFHDQLKRAMSLCSQHLYEAISTEVKLIKEMGGKWVNWELVGVKNKALKVEIYCVGQKIEVQNRLIESWDNFSTKIDSIIDSITDGFLIVDKNFRVTRLNNALLKIIRKPKSEIEFKNISEAFPWPPSEELVNQLKITQNEKKSSHFEEYYNPLNLWIEISIYPFSEGAIIYLRDISTRKKVENQLVRQNEQLIEISRYYSHEIRRPVASIMGLMNLLNKNTFTAQNLELIELLEICTIELDKTIKKIVHKTYSEHDK